MDRYEMAIHVLKWAERHPWEWGVICGFEDADLESNLVIAEMLREEKLYELCLMMTMRLVKMCLETE